MVRSENVPFVSDGSIPSVGGFTKMICLVLGILKGNVGGFFHIFKGEYDIRNSALVLYHCSVKTAEETDDFIVLCLYAVQLMFEPIS